MAKVLIVEDDALLNQAYMTMLERDKHTVHSAANGEDALAILESFEPEIILLDLLMPVVNGLDFLKAYEAPAKHSDVTIIVLSNLGDKKAVEQAKDLGAHDYLIKAHTTPRQLSQLVTKTLKAKPAAKSKPRKKT